MLTISFRKFGNGVYISHKDILRCLNRTFRRAGVPVEYSKGFNRHMVLKLSQPLPFAVASDEEWVSADINKVYEKEEFLRLFNEACPPYIEATDCFYTASNPKLASIINATTYEIKCACDEGLGKKITALKERCVFFYKDKNGEDKEKDVTHLIYGLEVESDRIKLFCAFGSDNVRIDLFVEKLNREFGLQIALADVVRKGQYVRNDGVISVKEYMERICEKSI